MNVMNPVVPLVYYSGLSNKSDYFYFLCSVCTIVAHVWDPHPPPYKPFLECPSLHLQPYKDVMLSSLKTGAWILVRFLCVPHLSTSMEGWLPTFSQVGGTAVTSISFPLRRGETSGSDLQKQLPPCHNFHYCLKYPLTITKFGQNHGGSREVIWGFDSDGKQCSTNMWLLCNA